MREHIDFVQAQLLPWEDGAFVGFPGATVKLLSRDDETGATSIILSLPKFWSRDSGIAHFDEEFYVLDGSLTVQDHLYLRHSYGFLPAGFSDNALRTPDGVTLLHFRSGTIAADMLGAETVASRLVRQVDLTNISWDGDFDRLGLGSMKNGARMRVLREDPVTSEITYVTATIAFRRGERAERHPVTQEFFLLSGELAGDLGTMQAGAYCVRPPMAKHAPYGSPTGALILFRSLGGKQETFWEDTDPFTFYPEHRPILPERLQVYGMPLAPPTCY